MLPLAMPTVWVSKYVSQSGHTTFQQELFQGNRSNFSGKCFNFMSFGRSTKPSQPKLAWETLWVDYGFRLRVHGWEQAGLLDLLEASNCMHCMFCLLFPCCSPPCRNAILSLVFSCGLVVQIYGSGLSRCLCLGTWGWVFGFVKRFTG